MNDRDERDQLSKRQTLPSRFRKAQIDERRALLGETFGLTAGEMAALGSDSGLLERTDALVENAVGYFALPIGIAPGFVIDGERRDIPLATEEPSVIAAASYAAYVTARAGGIVTSASDPVMLAQIYLEHAAGDSPSRVAGAVPELTEKLSEVLAAMIRRGGGLRGISTRWIDLPPEAGHSTGNRSPILRVHLEIDVRDAMGANLLDTAAERIAPDLERICGGTALMRILSNSGAERTARALIRIPVSQLARHNYSGDEVATRIVTATRIAAADPDRAVTHNKGIMNGVSALAAATGNDTRGVEAAVHAFAARSGRYTALSTFRRESGDLVGEVELPAPFGTVGGATSFHPAARASLEILGKPSGPMLGRIAAAVGLAQNFAALSALVTEGIQTGHMRLHARRVAYDAGARGDEVSRLAARLLEADTVRLSEARILLSELRGSGDARG